MNRLQIQQIENKLDELEKFDSREKTSYEEEEIIDWIAECTNLFNDIGVDVMIIRYFLSYFSFRTEKVKSFNQMCMPLNISSDQQTFKKIKTLGPFMEKYTDETCGIHKTGKYVLVGSFSYAKVAFSIARNVLKKSVQESRLVPLWITEQLLEFSNLAHISSSLELMERNYQEKNTRALISGTTTLLESFLNLDGDLIGKKLGGKLNYILSNNKKQKELGVSRDLITGLNNSRVIRNLKIDHKDIPLRCDIPFLVAVSFAYLTVFFLECVILNSDFIPKKLK